MDEVHQPAGHVFRCALWVYLGALDQIVVRKPDWTFFCQVWTKKCWMNTKQKLSVLAS